MQKIVEVYQKYWNEDENIFEIYYSFTLWKNKWIQKPQTFIREKKVKKKKIDILGKKKGRSVCMIYSTPWFKKGSAVVNL